MDQYLDDSEAGRFGPGATMGTSGRFQDSSIISGYSASYNTLQSASLTDFDRSSISRTTQSHNRTKNSRGGTHGRWTYADDDSVVSSEVSVDNTPPVRQEPQRPPPPPPPPPVVEPIIQQESQQLTAVMETDAIAHRGINDDRETQQERAGVLPRTRREWCIVLFAVIAIIAVAVGVGLGVGLAFSGSSGNVENGGTVVRNPSVPSSNGGAGDGDDNGGPLDDDVLAVPNVPSPSPNSTGSSFPTITNSPTYEGFSSSGIDANDFAEAIEYHLISQEISDIASFRGVADEGGDSSQLSPQQRARDFLVLLDFLPSALNDEDEDPLDQGENGKLRFLNATIGSRSYLRTSTPAYRVVQRFVIATLFFAANGTDWRNNDLWIEPGVHECNWLGIICEEISIPAVTLSEALRSPEKLPLNNNGDVDMTMERMVVEINLPENNLAGILPQEIVALPYLQALGLWSNMIGGTIPTQLGKLLRLQSIHLDDNMFTGTIPTEIGFLAEMRSLGLGQNDVNGDIPTELGQLINLERLWLSDMQLGGSVPAEIGSMKLLADLNLRNNNLGKKLPDEIKNLQSLESLILSSNSFTNMIPDSWNILTNLRHLEVANNRLRGRVPDFFSQFPYLETALFQENDFHGKLPSSIGFSGRFMKKINFSENKLEGEIPESIKECTNLERLELSSNQIKGAIPEWIGDLTKLAYLDLSDNRLSGSVPPQLSKLTNLRELRLDKNSLSGTVPCGFLEAVAFLSADCQDNEVVSCGCCTLCT